MSFVTETEATAQRRLEANIWKYYLFQFLLNLQLWWPIWIIYLTEERGLTLGQVTLIDVPFWLSIILLQVPAAAIADRWGRKPALIAASCFFSVAVTMFGLAATFPLLLASYLIWGVGFSLLFGTESAFIYDTLKGLGREGEYSRIYGRAWALATAAALVGTLVGAPLASATSLSLPIVLSGGLASLAALAALTLREPPRESSAAGQLSYGRIIRDSFALARRKPAVRYSVLFYGVITIGSIGPIFFFQPFLREHGVDLGQVGLWQTPMRIAGVFGALAAHRIMLSLGERWTFTLMPVVIFGSYALLGTWNAVYAQAVFPLMNFMVVLSQPTVTDYLNRRVPTEQRATVLSLTNLTRSLVLIPSAPLLGALADRASLSAGFWAGGILIAALGFPLLALWSPVFREDEQPAVTEAEPAAVAGPD